MASNLRKTALYGFAYTEAALKYLESRSSAKVRRQIKRHIELLAANPVPPKCKKLQGATGGENPIYRVRSGDYRILYSIRGLVIVILDIDHRKDVYR
ncbi:MAG: type II toxin-antitoxin system RelE/ParE family toxin [Proteobacteria bacterium]|nr:type II toxin-antitoxin system RelE/ParE family toxin [Pseudomonadota bacterium]